jgi:hypothetical protein
MNVYTYIYLYIVVHKVPVTELEVSKLIHIHRHTYTHRHTHKLTVIPSCFQALDKFKPGDKVTISVLRGPNQEPKQLSVTLGAFKGSAFSKLESEKGGSSEAEDGIPPMNIPLGNIAPAIIPQMPQQ